MQSIQDVPALTFEDILHSPSPSPIPQPQPTVSGQVTTASNPKQSFYTEGNGSPISRDDDLDNQNTSSSPNGHTDQLTAQAEAISTLILQRAFLLSQREDERSRWNTERESWQRSLEVLVSKRRVVADAATIDEETRRRLFGLESDNKFLKQKLTESQQRVVLLEGELNRLRPLLLSQPVDDLHYDVVFPTPSLYPPKPPPPKRRTKKEKEADLEKEKEAAEKREAGAKEKSMDSGDGKSTKDVTQNTPESNGEGGRDKASPVTHIQDGDTQVDPSRPHRHASVPQPPPSGSQHYRLLKEREAQASQVRKSAKHDRATTRGTSSAHTTLLADARNEVLLNAVRKFGRLKAGLYAGIIKVQDKGVDKEPGPVEERVKEKEKEKEPRKRVRKPTVQKDPQGGANPQRPLETPGAGPSTSVTDRPTSPSTPSHSPARIAVVHGAPPHHVQALPAALHPSTQHPTHQFVYISPVQASGRAFMPTMQSLHTNPNNVPMYVSYWPPQPGTPVPGASASVVEPSTPVSGQKTAEKVRRTRQRGRRRKDTLETVQDGSATPMDSLVSAARSILVDEGENGTDGDFEAKAPMGAAAVGMKRRRGGRTRGVDTGSPQPKRRRVANTIPKSLHPSTLLATPHKGGPPPHSHTLAALATPAKGAPPTRTRSGLDVLADTAQEQERRLSVDEAGSRRQSPEPRGAVAHSGAVASSSRKGEQRATADKHEDEISTRSRSLSREPQAHPIDFRHANHRPVFEDRNEDVAESEISEGESDSEPSPPQSPSPQGNKRYYRLRKALHQYQFVPPFSEAVRTPSRTARATDQLSPTRSPCTARDHAQGRGFVSAETVSWPDPGTPAMMGGVRATTDDPDLVVPRAVPALYQTLLSAPRFSDPPFNTDPPRAGPPEPFVTTNSRHTATSLQSCAGGPSEATSQLPESTPPARPGNIYTDTEGPRVADDLSGLPPDIDTEDEHHHSVDMPLLDDLPLNTPDHSHAQVADMSGK